MKALTFCAAGAAAFATAVVIVVHSPATSCADSTRTVTVRAGAEYDHGSLWRTLFGDDWRDAWSEEITVPVLDLDRFAGGLTPYKAGGNQTRTLRFKGADGRTYMFRSTHKRVAQSWNVPGNSLVQDQTASLHPTGLLAVAVLQHEAGLLQPVPQLVCLPDDPKLGEFREKFAHMLGTISERPDDKGPVFAGAEKIRETEELIAQLEQSSANRLDSREYLAARLIDFLIGDTDRGGDQWFFAQFDRGDGNVFRTIPRDRDYAFLRMQGLLPGLARAVNPKMVSFDAHYPSLHSLRYTSSEFDRSHLVDMEWPEWDAVVARLQRRLTDPVIDRAIRALPEGHRANGGDEIAAALKARRDAMPAVAREYYLMVNREADVFASDDPERADIERHPDGRVTVRMWRLVGAKKADALPASTEGASARARESLVFERTFVPGETREIRVYLERGDDQAVVRGSADRSILVRVAGGEGDDMLKDTSRSRDGAMTRFYDASGRNTFVRGENTRVTTASFVTAPPIAWDDDVKEREKSRVLKEERRGRTRDLMKGGTNVIDPNAIARYWGEDSRWAPMAGYRESGGVVLGIGPSLTEFGFRRQPYKWRGRIQGMLGTRTGELGVRLSADRHLENSPWSLTLAAHASNLELNRFYGYGNDTPLIDEDLTMIERFEVLVQPSVRRRLGEAGALELGPVVRYVVPQLPAESPVTDAMPPGSAPFGQAGVRAELVVDAVDAGEKQQSGVGFNAGASAYPALWDAGDAFGEAHAVARAFIPLGWPTLALRAGGRRNWGTFPLHESAFIGGRWTVRGFRWNRFAGDTSAYGTAELRVPVAKISRGRLGVIGFGDAGRVWLDGHSAGDWHTGAGGGLWFGNAQRQASVTYARGDEHRVYFYLGLPF